jgi:hypothetical protein
MSITIFEDKNCNGASRTVSRDIADLQGQCTDKPSSITLTADDEEVLLFKHDDWHGGVLYLRGPKTVSDLGRKDDGGKDGFGNSIGSVPKHQRTLDGGATGTERSIPVKPACLRARWLVRRGVASADCFKRHCG